MRDDFAVLILTHGRADNVVTMKTLQRQGYSGKWYMVIDDEDDMADDYRRNFGEEHIVTFCKQEAVDRADTMDNLDEHRAILYARNESFRIARDLGLKYFLMLDDDYSDFLFRFPEGKKMASKTPRGKTLERIFEAMLGFLDASGAATVAFAQGGDFIGGLRGGNFKKRLLRKAMNSFFCRVDRPIQFRGTMNEDVTTYTTLGSRGELFFTFVDVPYHPNPHTIPGRRHDGCLPGERDIPENLLFSHVHAVLYQGRDDVQQEQPDTPPHRLGVLRPQDTEREIPKGEIASCRA